MIDLYIADTQEHGVYGYDGDLFPMNFNGPFLIECGFPVGKKSMLKSISNTGLANIEHDYIEKY